MPAKLDTWAEWPEIELRLRYGMSPTQVVHWFAERYPGKTPPKAWTLQRFLERKPSGWFMGRQLLEETIGTHRLLVLQEQVELILVTKRRIQGALKTEQALGGFMMPELREMTALYMKLLMDHHKVQQEMGLEPKRIWSLEHPEGEEGTDPGTAMLIERIVKAPSAEFLSAMQALGFAPKPMPKWVGNGEPPRPATGPVFDVDAPEDNGDGADR